MKVDTEVIQVLDNAEINGAILYLKGQLDRNLYQRVNKVLESAGGKWDRKQKGHVFTEEIEDVIDRIVLTGTVTRPQDFGYFPTPEPIVKMLIARADIKPNMKVLEPSAGQGNIVKHLMPITPNIGCVELLEKNAEVLNKLFGYPGVVQRDFLSLPPDPSYDRVVMNPPFDRKKDIIHVNHALKFLKPDGLLVSIMSAGLLFRMDKVTCLFRDEYRARGLTVEELPEGSFKESGTMVRTVMVTIPGEKYYE